MGLGSTLEYISDLLHSSSSHTHSKKRKTLQTVDLKIKMDCDGCVRKVKNALSSMKGVKNVTVDKKQSRVTITGYVEAKKLVKKVQSTGKKAEIWPYVPYNLVSHPYAAGTYDKRAPSGYVRKVEQFTVPSQAYGYSQEEQLTSMFSDENPNSCSVM